MKCLVTGSNGFIGSHLVEKLLERNYQVKCLIRKTSNLRWIHNLPVEFVYGDVTDIDSLIPAVADMDFVYHLGGAVRAKTEAGFYQANYYGILNLLNACTKKSSPLKKFIFVSSQAASGPASQKLPRREIDPPQPISIYGKSKLKAEEAVLAYQKYFPVSIVRPPSVYGPRDDDILEIFKYIKWHIKPLLGQRDKYISLIHVYDLIKGILLISENSKSIGQIYFLANDKIYSIRDIESEIEKAMNKKAIQIRIPEIIIDLFSYLSEFRAKFSNKPALVNKDKALEMKQRYWLVDSTKAKNELGFRTEISLTEGIKETLVWYQQNGWL